MTSLEKPCKYFLIHNVTKEVKDWSHKNFKNTWGQTDGANNPFFNDLCEWVEIKHGVKERQQVWTAYEDTRYEAKLRLYNYLKNKK